MKKIILIASCFVLGFSASAQLKDIMRNKVNDKLNKNTKTEPKSENTTTAPADTTRPTTTHTNTQPAYGGWGAGNKAGKNDIAAEYSFQHNMHIELESIKKGATSGDKTNMIMFLTKDQGNYSGVEMKLDPKKPNDRILSIYEYDKKQSVMYMHNDGKKYVRVAKYESSLTDTAAAANGLKFTKTGRVKTILTYKCEEWTGVDKDGAKYELWVTNDINIPVNEYLRKNAEAQKGRQRSQVDYSNFPTGLMMEMNSVDKEGNKTIWKVTAINKDQPFTVKTSEYDYMGF